MTAQRREIVEMLERVFGGKGFGYRCRVYFLSDGTVKLVIE